MTGEITLRGRVLPIGGLREKTMAAYLAGVKTIMIPADNKIDEKDIIDEVKQNVEIVYISKVDEALKIALSKNPFERTDDKTESDLRQLASTNQQGNQPNMIN